MIMSPFVLAVLVCTVAGLSSALPAVVDTLAAAPVQDSQDPLNIAESEFLVIFWFFFYNNLLNL